ncbi:hypothetical protein MBLNU457_4589t1 [Dothideomycetes sp. NU457]
MPPKKGKAASKAVATPADTPRQTRGKQPDVPASAASTRSKRGTAVNAPEEPLLTEKRTVHHYRPEQTDQIVDVKTSVHEAPKRGRGRPPVKRHDETLVSEVEQHDETEVQQHEETEVQQHEETDDVPPSAASNRSKRNTAASAPAQPLLKEKRTVHHYQPDQTDNIVEVKTPVHAAPKRGRGRLPVKRHDETIVSEIEQTDETEGKPASKKRGRPAKKAQHEVEQPEEEADEIAEPTPKRGRGRPSLKKTTEAVEEPEEVDELVEPEPESTPKRGRGRPRPDATENEPPKKRGRQSKAAQTEEVREEAEFDDADAENGAEAEQETDAAPKKKGRPSKAAKAEEVREQADFDDADSNDDERQASEQQTAPKKRGRPAKNNAVDAPAEDNVEEPPAKRGRKAKTVSKQEESEEPAKKRGRPAKQQEEEPAEEKPAPRKRGRPSKAATQAAPEPKSVPASKKRGRPAKAAAEPDSETETAPPAKKRGRPPKATTKVASKSQTTQAPAKRGRPAKAVVDNPKAAPKKRGRPVKVAMDGAADEDDETEAEPATKKRARGRPAKATASKKGGKDKAVADADDDEEADTSNEINPTEATTEIAPSEASGRQYWLMKAEPETRMEKTESGKTVDVKFSIDDLAAKLSPEPWDGIRNAVASKNMRAMNPGDLAFFYESNCKVPGIVGLMEIVKEADVDLSAFDKESAYYDAKSNPDKPRWMNAYVEFRRKFDKISLKDLQSYGQKGGELEGMELLKLSRLSVSKVSPSQWAFIMSLIDKTEAEDTITVAGASGSSKPTQAQSSKQAQSPGPNLNEQVDNTSAPEPAEEAEQADFASAFEAPATLSSSPAKNATSCIGGIVEEIVEDTVDAADAAVTSVAAGLAHNLGDQVDIDMVDVSHEHHHHYQRSHSLGNNGEAEIETVHKDPSVATPSLADRDEGNGTFDAIEVSSIKTRTPVPEEKETHSHGLLDTLKATIGLSPSRDAGPKPASRASSAAPPSATTAKVKEAVIAAAGSLEQNVMEPGRERSKTQTSTQTVGEDTFVTADGLADAEAGAGQGGARYEFEFDESEMGNGNGNGDDGGVGEGVDGALARPLSYS